MCGICLVVTEGRAGSEEVCALSAVREARELLARRGPDFQSCECFWHGAGDQRETGSQVGICMASVLHMRGMQAQAQPIQRRPMPLAMDSFLCWNGEVFAGDVVVNPEENDGLQVFKRLCSAEEAEGDELDLSVLLAGVEGPFAFVFWQAAKKRLWFGRDPVGRRSLLVCRPRVLATGVHQVLAISSVAFQVDRNVLDWLEVPPDSLHYVDFPLVDSAPAMSCNAEACEEEQFANLARRLDICSLKWKLPLGARLDARTVLVDEGGNSTVRYEVPAMILPRGSRQERSAPNSMPFDEAVDGLERHLRTAVARRVQALPSVEEGLARLALLFSGGLDSMVLASLADDVLPAGASIDLLNVAFGKWPFDVPDRRTGRSSARVLQRRSPTRRWRFIEVNVEQEELAMHEQDLLHMVWPRGTVMDMTIGPALWFAARGVGIVQVQGLEDEEGHTVRANYEEAASQAKVLLLGHGADEQLAGYGRHRGAWKKRGLAGVRLELDRDTARLWLRNLGRDDRVISSLGKESRLPYLDRDVMEYVSQLDLELLCDFEEPAGLGDKRILREVARRLGLVQASALPKRALQFGSRISKLTSSKDGGHVAFQGYH